MKKPKELIYKKLNSSEFNLLYNISFQVLDADGQCQKTGFFFTSDGWGLTTFHPRMTVSESVNIIYHENCLTGKVTKVFEDRDVAVLSLTAPPPDLSGCFRDLCLSTDFSQPGDIYMFGYSKVLDEALFQGKLEKHQTSETFFQGKLEKHQTSKMVSVGAGQQRHGIVVKGQKRADRGCSGGPVLLKSGSTNCRYMLIGMIFGSEDVRALNYAEARPINKEYVSGGRFSTEVLPPPTETYFVPFEFLTDQWPELQYLLDQPTIKEMGKAIETIRQKSNEETGDWLDGSKKESAVKSGRPGTLLPVPQKNSQFLMDAYLVTNSQYREFINEKPYWRKGRGCLKDGMVDQNYLALWPEDHCGGSDDLPVVNICWNAANAYSEWRTENDGKYTYRIPTVSQWIEAVRAGRHSNGNWLHDDIDNNGIVLYKGITQGLMPVNSSPRENPWGFVDLLGNAINLCSADDENKDASDKAVLCGGGIFTPKKKIIKISDCTPIPKKKCLNGVGFRCVAIEGE